MTVEDVDQKIAHTDRGKHVDMKTDVSGQVQFTQVGSPTASTATATQLTTKVSTTGLVLASLFKSVTGTATGTASLTLKLSRDGSSLDSATTGGGGPTSLTPATQSTIITANSPTWTFRLSATKSTGLTVSGTVSREQRW